MRSFNNGVLAGMLVTVAATQGNWLIGSHPGASSGQYTASWALIILGLGGAVWLWVRERRIAMSGRSSS